MEFVDGADDIVRFSTYGRGVWDLRIESQPLPLEWLRFIAEPKAGNRVALDWATAHEFQVSRFDIERSADGARFQTIGLHPAQGGGAYHWTDNHPMPGVSYYRIRQVDMDGASSYTPMRLVALPGATQALRISPNPITGGQFTAYFEASNEPLELHIWDYQGRHIVRQSGWGDSGQLSVQLPSSTGLGPVLVQLVYRGRTEVVKGVVW